jgi:hypothetical protein
LLVDMNIALHKQTEVLMTPDLRENIRSHIKRS